MDVHIDQLEADITPPARPAGAATPPTPSHPAQAPEAETERVRQHLHHIGSRRERLRAD